MESWKQINSKVQTHRGDLAHAFDKGFEKKGKKNDEIYEW